VLTITAQEEPRQGSRQKPRLLPAATKLLSEKSASATFFQFNYRSFCMSASRTGRPSRKPLRNLRIASFAILGSLTLGLAHADSTAELDDAAARLQYAFYTADARHLEEVLTLVDRLQMPSNLAAMKDYYAAYGQWKLAQLYSDDSVRSGVTGGTRAAASKAAQACIKRSEEAFKLEPRMDEAYAINAVCSAFGPGLRLTDRPAFSGCARSRPMRTAQQFGADNPRVMLIEAICLGGNDAAASTAMFDKLREALLAFESAAPSRPGKPDWGQAEALVLLGQSYLKRGDSLAARDAIERALVLAPDYRKAQELLQPAATRPR
jgi:tetratricopeptide (TPR) repeat protein